MSQPEWSQQGPKPKAQTFTAKTKTQMQHSSACNTVKASFFSDFSIEDSLSLQIVVTVEFIIA